MAFDPLTSVFDIAGKVLDRVWPDPDQKAKAGLALAKLKQDGDLAFMQSDLQLLLGNIEINKIEALHGGKFKGGWRPFIGWTCGVALAYHFIIRDFFVSTVQVIAYYVGSVDANGLPIPVFPIDLLPQLDMVSLIAIVTGMLGLSVTRSKDKAKSAGN